MLEPAALQRMLAGLFPDTLGIEWLEIGTDRIRARMPVRRELCTAGDVLHGGALMALADTLGAVGTYVNLPKGARTTTIDSSTKFLAAAPLGSSVEAECTALHRGRTTQVWQTLIRGENDRLCAVVTQSQLVLTGS
ncbi:MAG TPA: PaaI family thioesterase [Zeimonas sp.]|nr:PaaI family thioesterase [Zeimonas sp.]